MLRSVEVNGKTKEEAVNNALAKLNADIDDVLIDVIEEGSRGFLGIGSKPFKVKVSIKSDPVKDVKDFLREVFICIGVSVDISCDFSDEKNLDINLKGDNMGVIIGKRGQTLDALQYLTSIIINKKHESFVNVKMDTEYYRDKRKETLEKLAIGLAKKAKHLRKDVVLEPMNPKERRIIHSTLQNDRYVTTHSEGEGNSRYVVITLKDEYKDGGYFKDSYRSGYKSDYRSDYKSDYRSDYKSDYKSDYRGEYRKYKGSYRSGYKSDYSRNSYNNYNKDRYNESEKDIVDEM